MKFYPCIRWLFAIKQYTLAIWQFWHMDFAWYKYTIIELNRCTVRALCACITFTVHVTFLSYMHMCMYLIFGNLEHWFKICEQRFIKISTVYLPFCLSPCPWSWTRVGTGHQKKGLLDPFLIWNTKFKGVRLNSRGPSF